MQLIEDGFSSIWKDTMKKWINFAKLCLDSPKTTQSQYFLPACFLCAF